MGPSPEYLALPTSSSALITHDFVVWVGWGDVNGKRLEEGTPSIRL